MGERGNRILEEGFVRGTRGFINDLLCGGGGCCLSLWIILGDCDHYCTLCMCVLEIKRARQEHREMASCDFYNPCTANLNLKKKKLLFFKNLGMVNCLPLNGYYLLLSGVIW